MANQLQIKNRTAVIKEKMTAIMRTIAKDYDAGRIKSPAELQHRVYQDLKAFYASIGKPTFQPKLAWGPPYSSDHNTMMKQLQDDLVTLYSEAIYMTQDLSDNFQQVELERQGFDNRLQKLTDELKGISLGLAADREIIFRDYFVDHEQFAKDMVKLEPANLSAKEGLLTLARTESDEFNEYASITILSGNGFPGNTHIVRSISSTLKFDGEEELHINLSDILDGNADTWFEYEIMEISDQGEAVTESKGFEYQEAIDWITHGTDPLRLVVQISLDKAKTMNWVSLSPFIPSDKGSTPAVIEKIIIDDGQGTVYTTGQQETFDTEKGYLFPRQKVSTIQIHLRQNTGYEVSMGHMYFKQINKETASIVGAAQNEGVRIHGPGPSIRNLGVVYDTGKREIIYPIQKFGDKIEGEAEKKRLLFTPPSMPNNILTGLEQVDGWRYVIGMRDAVIANYVFGTESEYVSKPFYSTTPLKEIELEVDFDLPAVFPQDEEWISYAISIDGGQNWNPIHPRNTYRSEAITKYIINSGTAKEARVPEIGYLDSLTDIFQLQLQITMKRPNTITDAQFYTPIIYGYELHVTTQEEAR